MPHNFHQNCTTHKDDVFENFSVGSNRSLDDWPSFTDARRTFERGPPRYTHGTFTKRIPASYFNDSAQREELIGSPNCGALGSEPIRTTAHQIGYNSGQSSSNRYSAIDVRSNEIRKRSTISWAKQNSTDTSNMCHDWSPAAEGLRTSTPIPTQGPVYQNNENAFNRSQLQSRAPFSHSSNEMRKEVVSGAKQRTTESSNLCQDWSPSPAAESRKTNTPMLNQCYQTDNVYNRKKMHNIAPPVPPPPPPPPPPAPPSSLNIPRSTMSSMKTNCNAKQSAPHYLTPEDELKARFAKMNNPVVPEEVPNNFKDALFPQNGLVPQCDDILPECDPCQPSSGPAAWRYDECCPDPCQPSSGPAAGCYNECCPDPCLECGDENSSFVCTETNLNEVQFPCRNECDYDFMSYSDGNCCDCDQLSRQPSGCNCIAPEYFETEAWGICKENEPFTEIFLERQMSGPDDLEIAVLYCGLNDIDARFAFNVDNETTYPFIPGCEVVGVVCCVGRCVPNCFCVGDHVAVGPIVGSCLKCPFCRTGEEIACVEEYVRIFNAEVTHDQRVNTKFGYTCGGMCRKMVVHYNFVVKLDKAFPLMNAAPLMTSGVTIYSALKTWGASKGCRAVGVIGLGGRGLLAVKMAVEMGNEVWAIEVDKEDVDLVQSLGANVYIMDDCRYVRSLRKFDLILNTLMEPHNAVDFTDLLRVNGVLIQVGTFPLRLRTAPMMPIHNRRMRLSVAGAMWGGMRDAQETLDYCNQRNIALKVECITAEHLTEAARRLLDIPIDPRVSYVVDIQNSKFYSKRREHCPCPPFKLFPNICDFFRDPCGGDPCGDHRRDPCASKPSCKKKNSCKWLFVCLLAWFVYQLMCTCTCNKRR